MGIFKAIEQFFCKHDFIMRANLAFTHNYLECMKCGKTTPGLRIEKRCKAKS